MPKKPTENPLADWPGFSAPQYTQIPDEFFDHVAPFLSEAELRVMLYILRRTFGWKKESDTISTSQIEGGIIKKDGTRLDHGAHVAHSTAVRAITGLVAKGLITQEHQSSAEKGNEATLYHVRMRPLFHSATRESQGETTPSSAIELPLVSQQNTQQTVSKDSKQEDAPTPIDPTKMTPEELIAWTEQTAPLRGRSKRS